MRRADAIEMALLDLLDVLEEFSSLPPGLVKEARAAVALPRQGYRRGLGRLVGNARCSECRTHQPALTCFDCDPADGSCGWMVCVRSAGWRSHADRRRDREHVLLPDGILRGVTERGLSA